MILAITNKCSMGCTHCLSDCKPDGEHITLEQFKKNLAYAMNLKTYQPILISGGEPLEHPYFMKIMYELVRVSNEYTNKPIITIITNGYPLLKEPVLYDWYISIIKENPYIITQVTNWYPYYPYKFTKEDKKLIKKIPNVFLDDDTRQLRMYPQGRALNLNPTLYRTKGPKCGDTILIALQNKTPMFKNASSLFELMGGVFHKFCQPRINIDGSIALGESALCPTIGNIEDDDRELYKKILKFNCRKCTYAWNVLLKNTKAMSLLDNR